MSERWWWLRRGAAVQRKAENSAPAHHNMWASFKAHPTGLRSSWKELTGTPSSMCGGAISEHWRTTVAWLTPCGSKQLHPAAGSFTV